MAAKEPTDGPPWVAEIFVAVEEARERTERKVEELSTSILKELRAAEARQQEALERAMALRRKATTAALEQAALARRRTASSARLANEAAAVSVPVAVSARGPSHSFKLDNQGQEPGALGLPEDDVVIAQIKSRGSDRGSESASRESEPGSGGTSPTFKSQHADTDLSLGAARLEVAEILGLDLLDDSKKVRKKNSQSGSSIISNSKQTTNKMNNCLSNMVKSQIFDPFCAVIIILNSFTLGMQADRQAENLKNYDAYDSRQPWATINLCFVTFFVCEIVARILVYKKLFFKGSDKGWNIFDLLVVILALVEELIWVVHNDSLMAISQLRVLRLLRVVRIIRTLRVVHLLRDLRIMLSSITSAMVPFFWACILLLVMHWCFGVYFVLAATDFIEDTLEREGREWLAHGRFKRLHKHFGTVSNSIYTLFMTITGGIDWENAAASLLDVGNFPFFLYMFFIALTLFAVLNIVTAVFVNNATKMAMEDRDLVIQETLENREKYIKDAVLVFSEADEDGNLKVTWEEFQKHLQDPRVQAFFSMLELTGLEARRLFRMLDLNGDGHVDADEFVSGCLCLRGQAKTLDMAALIFEQRKEARKVHNFMTFVEDQFALLTLDAAAPRERFEAASV